MLHTPRVQLALSKQMALGIGAFLFVLSSFAGAWFAIPAPLPDAARFVPAEQTLAFFSGVDEKNVSLLASHFSLLQNIPVVASDSSIAILQTGTGKTAWVLFEPQLNKESPFHITSSAPETQALLANVLNPLSRDASYRMFHPDSTENSAWGWVRFPAVSLARESTLAHLLGPDRAASFAVTKDSASIRLLAQDNMIFPTLTTGPKEIFQHPLFILHFSNGKQLINLLQKNLQPNPLLVSQTVIRQALEALFGKTISPTYDLLPLLSNTTTIQAALDNTQHVRVVVEGQTSRDPKDIDALGALFKGTLGTLATETHTFDEKFTMQEVHQDLSLVEDNASTENGWHIRSIVQKETGKQLWIGTRGSAFILSNDADGFKKTLTQSAPALSAIDQNQISLGLLQSTDLHAFLQKTMPTVWQVPSIPAGTGGYLKWKLSQEGPRLTLLFKKI